MRSRLAPSTSHTARIMMPGALPLAGFSEYHQDNRHLKRPSVARQLPRILSRQLRLPVYIPENYKDDADYNKKLSKGCKRADRLLTAQFKIAMLEN